MDESIALVEFSKRSRRVWSKPFDDARVEVGSKIRVPPRHHHEGTALLEAATAGSVEVMELLMARGADPLVVDDDGVTALMSAASQGMRDATAFLPGQDKRATFPTSKAPFSAVFHSFRLIFGRATISRNGLEAWMLLSERARAEHSR